MAGEILRTIKPLTDDPTGSLGRILVVDDEEYNRTLLHDTLEARGYEVTEAADGFQALQQMAACLPDVLLLDLMMPKMDGLEVCRRIRKDARASHIPILMITALSARKDRLLGIESGANDFLNKPVDLQDMMLRVANAVHSKHLHDQIHDQLQTEQAKFEQLLLNEASSAFDRSLEKNELDKIRAIADLTRLSDWPGHRTEPPIPAPVNETEEPPTKTVDLPTTN